MKATFLTAFLTIASLPLAAQVMTPPQPYTELKAYLGLSDTQLKALLDVQTSQRAAEMAIYKQINEKQQLLNSLLKGPNPDPLHVGQLTVDINNLRHQLPLSGEPYHTDALKILDAAQNAKLATLNQVLLLILPANQAVTLNLLIRPVPVFPVPFNPLLRDTQSGNPQEPVGNVGQ